MDDKTNAGQTLSNQANQSVHPPADGGNLESVTQVPVSTTVQKEQEPVVVQKSETETVLSSELKEIGVETKTEVPKLTEDHEKIGVVHAKETTQVQTQPQGIVQIPLTQSKANQVIKTNKIKDSILWLATLVLKQLRKGNNN